VNLSDFVSPPERCLSGWPACAKVLAGRFVAFLLDYFCHKNSKTQTCLPARQGIYKDSFKHIINNLKIMNSSLYRIHVSFFFRTSYDVVKDFLMEQEKKFSLFLILYPFYGKEKSST
jgi:hypothetical protein